MTRATTQVRVLIAERTLGIAELIARSLRSHGYSIAGIVNSAEKALEFAITTVPDVVLLDLPLQGEMDTLTAGWQILSEIHCPVIYMTAHLKEVDSQAETLNPYGFLLKPFTVDELKTTIEQTLAQHQHQMVNIRNGSTPLYVEETDEQILSLLALASSISPHPRILFVSDRISVYTCTLDAAAQIKAFCQTRFLSRSYQVFTWRWETRQYQLYAQKI